MNDRKYSSIYRWSYRGEFLLMMVFVLVFSGCAGNLFTVPADPEKRIFYENFSFLPPKGKNWKTTKKPIKRILLGSPSTTIMFRKSLFQGKPTSASEAETVAAGAEILIFFNREEKINNEMLLAYIKKMWIHDPGHPRYKSIDFQYSFDESYGTPCLRYDSIAEDRMVPGFPNSIFIFRNWGLTCVHEKYKNEIYTLNASQRYLKGESPTNLQLEFEPLLGSMQFHN